MTRARTLTAITGSLMVIVLAVAGNVAAQGTKSLAGTWVLVSATTTDTSGKKTPTFGDNPKGELILTADGRYMIVITRADLPKFAANSRDKGTTEENKTVVQGSIAHFGRVVVNEADKTLTFQVENATYPNWNGMSQKRSFTVSGDELRYHVPAASAGGKADVVWKRIK
jgi:Lipocalin-like domain